MKRNVYRILDGKPVGRTPLDRPRHRRSDNIKIDVREIGWEALDWICVRIEISDGLLWTRYRFHKMQAVS